MGRRAIPRKLSNEVEEPLVGDSEARSARSSNIRRNVAGTEASRHPHWMHRRRECLAVCLGIFAVLVLVLLCVAARNQRPDLTCAPCEVVGSRVSNIAQGQLHHGWFTCHTVAFLFNSEASPPPLVLRTISPRLTRTMDVKFVV